MTDVTSTGTATTTTTTQSSTKSSSASAISSDFETFLTLLTTQIQNQDPLNPMDSSEFASQLATFSGVEQQVKTNQLLESLVAQNQASTMSQMADWIGNEVRVASDVTYTGDSITIAPEPADYADTARLVVIDSLGVERSNIEIPVSNDPVEWTGWLASGEQLPNGSYTLEVRSYDVNGQLVDTSTPEIYAEVTEARAADDGITLVLKGGTVVSADKVTAVRSGS